MINRPFYPYAFEPVDLIVEQHLSIWQVNVAVIGIVQQMSEQSEVVPSMSGSLLGCTLHIDMQNFKLEFSKLLPCLALWRYITHKTYNHSPPAR